MADERLAHDHPYLATRWSGTWSLAAALLEAGYVLPVLDGFDEIAEGLRRPALRALSATALTLLLTNRPAEYTDSAWEDGPLTSAATVELTDLTPDDVAHYLSRHERGKLVWRPVLYALRGHRAAGAPSTSVRCWPLR